jgi:pimeloyl-ACP methyl ester carboxylesterase
VTRRLAYTDLGSGRAVLLVHGQPGAAADWYGVARALSDRFRVIAPDRPGYGATGGEPAGIRENARLLWDLLDDLDLDSVTVAGHSWGAAVALAMVSDPRVTGLVLVAPVSPVKHLGRGDRALADRRLGPVLARLAFQLAGTVIALPRAGQLLAAVLPGRDATAWSDTARSWRAHETSKAFWYEQRMLVDELPELADELHPLAIPATVVVGRRDVVTRPATGLALAEALGARLVEVPSAGHLIPQRMPDAVARAVAETAERAPSRRSS